MNQLSKIEYTEEQVFNFLQEVKDPEIPTISVVELGVVREVHLNDNVKVIITPTYSGCPALDVMRNDIIDKLKENGIENPEIEVRLKPAWTTDWMDDTGKEKLLESRIAPPIGNAGDVNNLLKVIDAGPVVPCTYCESKNTRLVNQFGTTACKALYQCNDCGQPFDYFKPH
jgi:ring-1,2-phenylacetyl-CoA epoxidase subunit PaaD